MEKNLPVPYISQEDPDAQESKDECGPTSAAMILNFFGEKLTPNQVFEQTGAGAGLETVAQLQEAITKLGYGSDYFRDQSFEQLKAFIDKGIPVIALVKAGYLNSREDKNFAGGHFMVIDGYRADNGVYANDPDFYGAMRAEGDHHNYTAEEFMKAWSSCHEDENPDCSFIVIYPKEKNTIPAAGSGNSAQTPPAAPLDPTLKTGTVITQKGLRGRSAPVINDSNQLTSYAPGTVLTILKEVDGDNVSGVITWYQVKDDQEKEPVYVWGGGLEIKEALAPTPPVPAAPQAANVATPNVDDYLKALQATYLSIKGVLVEHNALPNETTTPSQSFWDKVKTFLMTPIGGK